MTDPDPNRFTFHSICSFFALTSDDFPAIAEAAGVDAGVIDHLSSGYPVSHKDAESVLNALSVRCGELFTFANTAIPLLEEERP